MLYYIAGVATGAVLSLSTIVAYYIGKRERTSHGNDPPKAPVKPKRRINTGTKIVKPVGKGRTEVDL